MTARIGLTACLALFLVAACSSKQAPPKAEAAASPAPVAAADTGPATSDAESSRDYDCGGNALTATLASGSDGLVVATGGKTFALAHVESGSGSKYSDSRGNTFWAHGMTDALWTPAGSADVSCTAGSASGPEGLNPDQVTAFRAADRNRSGMVSFEEFRNYAVGAFHHVDANQDLTVTNAEYGGIKDPVDIRHFNEVLPDYFDRYDADKNGSLDLREWVSVPSADPSKPTPIN